MANDVNKFGELPMTFHNFNVNSGCNDITFSVTEECNLRCKYCYLAHKNGNKKMSFETAKKAVDYVLDARDIYNENSVVWNFIGGEPLLEIDLIDKISDYIKEQMFLKKHPWFDNYMFSISTNGILYRTEKVQNYIKKNRSHLSVGISIDGNKIKHDLQRVYPDGRGSFDDVMKSVPLWRSQFPNATTKATFSHDDLPYLKDSIIYLFSLGLKQIPANIVYEDVWQKGDEKIFEEQLKLLADYIIEKELFLDPEYTVQFFNPNIGLPVGESDKELKYCGSGKMLAVDCDGNFFPCIRFTDFSMSKKKFGWKVGNIEIGVNKDRLKPFELLSIGKLNSNDCENCKVASGCKTCVGHCYDESREGSIFQRTTYHCEMHKANVRAVDYFWNKVSSKLNDNQNPRFLAKKNINSQFEKYLLIYTDDSKMPHCLYNNKKKYERMTMPKDVFLKALNFASSNGMTPVIVGDYEVPNKDMNFIRINEESNEKNEDIINLNLNHIPANISSDICNLHIEKQDLKLLYKNIVLLLNGSPIKRINIVLDDLDTFTNDELNDYKEQLLALAKYLCEHNSNNNASINVFDKQKDCDCGVNTFSVAPNGKFYICPGIYFYDPDLSIGDLEDTSTINLKHLDKCTHCAYLNKKLTGEYDVEPNIVANIKNIENTVSEEFKKMLFEKDNADRLEVSNI